MELKNDLDETRSFLMEMTGAHWIAVKFHKSKPRGMRLSRPEAFCSAAAGAITGSGLLKVSSIPCGGSRYTFNSPGAKAPAMAAFTASRLHTLIDPQEAAEGTPRLLFRPEYVSFNLPGSGADLYLSFMLLESAANLAQAWTAVSGRKLNSGFSGVMSFCAEGAAAAMNSGSPALALGCAKANRTAGLQGQVCICLPEKSVKRLAAAWSREPAAVKAAA